MPGLGATNLLEKFVQAGGVQNAVGQVFQLRPGGTFQAQAKRGGYIAEAVLYQAKDQRAFTFKAASLNALLHTHQALALFPFLEPVGDHLVRLLQVVHFRKGLAGEPLR